MLRRTLSGVFALAGACCALCGTRPVRAQVDLAALARAVQGDSRAPLSAQALVPAGFRSGAQGRVPVIVRSADGSAPAAPGLVRVGSSAVAQLSPEQLLGLMDEQPGWRFEWAPPRHLLLDRADGWIRGSAVRSALGLSGQGVVLGIVDTGLELTHDDFRTPSGGTRVAWLLDFSHAPQGLQAELESTWGCTGDPTDACAVYSAADIDALLASAGDVPTDSFGHGSHVASLAGGNGRASPAPKYIGVAPEASYVVARVTRDNGGQIQDSDVLRAVAFVFDRAQALGMPAVVNLSLGSDFGSHDGSSALEQGLAAMVGPRFPGRAIVVAAGNSAGLYEGDTAGLPGPLGIHTEVSVAEGSASIVPVITPATDGSGTVTGRVYVWLQFRPGDSVSVSLYDKGGQVVPPMARGQATSSGGSGYTATIFNGGSARGSSSELGDSGAVVVIDGDWPSSKDFSIHLDGRGTAALWLESTGPLQLGTGALFPRGEKDGTINVPASSPALIAVGASINRTSWTDIEGEPVSLPKVGSLDPAPLDSTAFFSAAGPNSAGVMKPDIVAPGVFVAGVMATAADPRIGGSSPLFESQGRCEDAGYAGDCFVVDDGHAIASGTSMAAPIVSGAIALLFQRDPSLTQDAVRTLLQAGARPLAGVVLDEQQVGPGGLDLEGATAAQTASTMPVQRDPSARSWLALSASYAHPDPTWPLQGYVELRDDAGQLADGFEQSRLQLEADPAVVLEPLARAAPGLARFTVAAPNGSGGEQLRLRVLFDGREIASRTLPIGVDRWVVEGGVSLRGGCSAGGRGAGLGWLESLLGAGALALAFRASRNKACKRAARRGRDPDRADAMRPRRRY